VDNAGVNAPYVLVSSVFDGGAYRVQAGQRVMFEHGSLSEVVDQEKESCGCPPPAPKGNEFPEAQSEGLAPTPPTEPNPGVQAGSEPQTTVSLAYNGADHAPQATAAQEQPPAATANAGKNPASQPPATKKKPGFFDRVGRFFRNLIGAE
jgi:hypothetical protein